MLCTPRTRTRTHTIVIFRNIYATLALIFGTLFTLGGYRFGDLHMYVCTDPRNLSVTALGFRLVN